MMLMFRTPLLIFVHVQLFWSVVLCYGCLFYSLLWNRRLTPHGRSRV